MALGQGTGFSRFYSIGNKADLNEIDFLKAWATDPETNVIVGYLEGISNGPEFMRVARKVTRQKPIVAIKSGTTSAGSRAVSSRHRHPGRLGASVRRGFQTGGHHPGRAWCRISSTSPRHLPGNRCRRAMLWL